MRFLITFLEGLLSFISPCMLPMLPVYISYFGGTSGRRSGIFLRALFFVFGFTFVFCLLGLFAGSLGSLLRQYQTPVNIITGGIVILFGLSFLDWIHLPFFTGMRPGTQVQNIFSAILFGLIYAVSLTPCVGAFLGSALMLAANSSTAVTGALLLLVYALGMGVPFILSAILIDQLKSAFSFMKAHMRAINRICGVFLILVGLLMASGYLDRLLSLFS